MILINIPALDNTIDAAQSSISKKELGEESRSMRVSGRSSLFCTDSDETAAIPANYIGNATERNCKANKLSATKSRDK